MAQYCSYITSATNTTLTPTTVNGGGWPAALITTPFVYKHNGINYPLTSAGVYKLSVPGSNTTNIVIYDGDVETLLKSLTYFIVPGMTDEGKTQAQLNSKSYSSRINVLCSTAVNWARTHLTARGIASRVVRCLRSDTPNDFYDGHVMMEVYYSGAWHLVDMQLGLVFGSAWPAAKDVLPVLSTDAPISMHKYKVLNPAEPMINGVYCHASTIDMFLADDVTMKEYQKDIMQIPGIVHTDGLTYFYIPAGMESRQSWLLGLSTSYRVVPYATWLSMFY